MPEPFIALLYGKLVPYPAFLPITPASAGAAAFLLSPYNAWHTAHCSLNKLLPAFISPSGTTTSGSLIYFFFFPPI
jgi:hypothetical protein